MGNNTSKLRGNGASHHDCQCFRHVTTTEHNPSGRESADSAQQWNQKKRQKRGFAIFPCQQPRPPPPSVLTHDQSRPAYTTSGSGLGLGFPRNKSSKPSWDADSDGYVATTVQKVKPRSRILAKMCAFLEGKRCCCGRRSDVTMKGGHSSRVVAGEPKTGVPRRRQEALIPPPPSRRHAVPGRKKGRHDHQPAHEHPDRSPPQNRRRVSADGNGREATSTPASRTASAATNGRSASSSSPPVRPLGPWFYSKEDEREVEDDHEDNISSGGISHLSTWSQAGDYSHRTKLPLPRTRPQPQRQQGNQQQRKQEPQEPQQQDLLPPGLRYLHTTPGGAVVAYDATRKDLWCGTDMAASNLDHVTAAAAAAGGGLVFITATANTAIERRTTTTTAMMLWRRAMWPSFSAFSARAPGAGLEAGCASTSAVAAYAAAADDGGGGGGGGDVAGDDVASTSTSLMTHVSVKSTTTSSARPLTREGSTSTVIIRRRAGTPPPPPSSSAPETQGLWVADYFTESPQPLTPCSAEVSPWPERGAREWGEDVRREIDGFCGVGRGWMEGHGSERKGEQGEGKVYTDDDGEENAVVPSRRLRRVKKLHQLGCVGAIEVEVVS